MPGTRVYNYGMEEDLLSRLEGCNCGACLSLMRYFVFAAAEADATQCGFTVLRGEVADSVTHIISRTALTRDMIRTALANLIAIGAVCKVKKSGVYTNLSIYAITHFDAWTSDVPVPRDEEAEADTEDAAPATKKRAPKEPLPPKEGEEPRSVTKRRAALKESPYGERIERMYVWFTALGHTANLTEVEGVAAMWEVENVLRIDMENAPGCFERLGRIVKWATEDDFWRSNLLSLAALRKKTKGGVKKWMHMEARMLEEAGKAQQGTNGKADPPARIAPTDDSQMKFVDGIPRGDTSCACGGVGYREINGERGYCPNCERGRYLAGRKLRA